MIRKSDKVARLKLQVEKLEADVAQAAYRLNQAKADLKNTNAALKEAEDTAKKK